MKRFLIPLLGAALLAFAVFSVREAEVPLMDAPNSDEEPRYVIRGARWKSHDEEGTVRVQGSARVIRYYDDDSARLKDFSVKVQGKDGNPWVARAPEGYSPPQNRHRLHLSGGVEGDGNWPDGEPLIFNTEDVWVDSAEDTLETDSKVNLRSANRLGIARGLRISGKKESVVLNNEVEIHYVLPN